MGGVVRAKMITRKCSVEIFSPLTGWSHSQGHLHQSLFTINQKFFPLSEKEMEPPIALSKHRALAFDLGGACAEGASHNTELLLFLNRNSLTLIG